MSHFSDMELEFLKTQKLGRLATVNPKGQPQNAPVTFRYNAELDSIDIGGRYMSQSKKFRNVTSNPHVAFVVDDLVPVPWTVRGVEIRGTAEQIATGGKAIFGPGYDADEAILRIYPTQIISWGLDGHAYRSHNRKVADAGRKA